MEATSAYTPIVQSLIDHVNEGTPLPPDLEQNPIATGLLFVTEVEKIISARPVVVLTNSSGKTVSYKRPGAHPDLEMAFLRLGEDLLSQPRFNPSKHSFFQLQSPPLLSKHTLDLNLLCTTCVKVGLLRELYIEIVSHDTDYLAYSPPKQDDGRAGAFVFGPLGLSECACPYTFRLDSDRRQVLEQYFVQHILQVKPRRDETIRVLSVGSGGLLQDWRLIGLLIKEGYTKFEWVVVDSDYPELPELKRFKDFYRRLPDIHIDIIDYADLAVAHGELLGRKFQADALNAIDFNPGPIPLIDTPDLLAPHAKVFFGSKYHDFVINKEETVSLSRDKQSSILCKQVAALIPDDYEGELHIASTEYLLELMQLIAHLQKSKKAKLSVTFGNCHQTEKEIRGCFSFFFPSLQIPLELTTCGDIGKKVEQGTKFDILIQQDIEDSIFDNVFGSFKEPDKHVMGESSSVFFLTPDDVLTYTYNPSVRIQKEAVEKKEA